MSVKKVIVLLTALCILISTSLTSSCGEKEVADTGSTTEAAVQATTAQDTTDFAEPDYPVKDYEGREFNTLYINWGLFQNFFFTDSENGEIMNDAIYKRKTTIEERLNIKFVEKAEEDFNVLSTTLKKSVQIGRAHV